MSAHSPSPWHRRYHFVRDEFSIDANDADTVVAQNVAARNVHLIESAPKLLDALKQIAANSDEDNEWDAVDKLHANKTLALVAIAKAEGR